MRKFICLYFLVAIISCKQSENYDGIWYLTSENTFSYPALELPADTITLPKSGVFNYESFNYLQGSATFDIKNNDGLINPNGLMPIEKSNIHIENNTITLTFADTLYSYKINRIQDTIYLKNDDFTVSKLYKVTEQNRNFEKEFFEDIPVEMKLPIINSFNFDKIKSIKIRDKNDAILTYAKVLKSSFLQYGIIKNLFFLGTSYNSKSGINDDLKDIYQNDKNRLFLHLTKNMEVDTFKFLKSVIEKHQIEEVYLACNRKSDGFQLAYIEFENWEVLEWEMEHESSDF